LKNSRAWHGVSALEVGDDNAALSGVVEADNDPEVKGRDSFIRYLKEKSQEKPPK